MNPYIIKNDDDVDISHQKFYIANSKQNVPSNRSVNSCNVNYNIKKNIINVNLNPEDHANNSNFEEESSCKKNISNSKGNLPVEKNKLNYKYVDKNINEDLASKKSNNSSRNFNQESFSNSLKNNTSNSKKSVNLKQQINSNYFINKEYDEDFTGNPNMNLTNKVWPKSRTFLSIISKMFNENYINDHQRGILKEMIMDHNQELNNILEEYEIDADSKNLYESIIQLANLHDKLKSTI